MIISFIYKQLVCMFLCYKRAASADMHTFLITLIISFCFFFHWVVVALQFRGSIKDRFVE